VSVLGVMVEWGDSKLGPNRLGRGFLFKDEGPPDYLVQGGLSLLNEACLSSCLNAVRELRNDEAINEAPCGPSV